MNGAGRQTPLQRLEGEIRWYALQCMTAGNGENPLLKNELYEKLDLFMTNYGNDELKLNLWTLTKHWINDVAMEENVRNRYDPNATTLLIVPPNNAVLRPNEVKHLKQAFQIIGNQLKSTNVDEEIIFKEPRITEIIRFWKAIVLLKEPEFSQIIKQLWSDFHEPVLHAIELDESWKPVISGIDEFEALIANGSSKVVACFMCNKKYTGLKPLRQHIIDHHSIFDFKCQEASCPYNNISERCLHSHERGIHYICTHCRVKFSSPHELESHIVQLHPEIKAVKRKLEDGTQMPKKRRNSTPKKAKGLNKENSENAKNNVTCMDQKPSSSKQRSPLALKSCNTECSLMETVRELELKVMKLEEENTSYKNTAFLQQKLISSLCEKFRTCEFPLEVTHHYQFNETSGSIEPVLKCTPIVQSTPPSNEITTLVTPGPSSNESGRFLFQHETADPVFSFGLPDTQALLDSVERIEMPSLGEAEMDLDELLNSVPNSECHFTDEEEFE